MQSPVLDESGEFYYIKATKSSITNKMIITIKDMIKKSFLFIIPPPLWRHHLTIKCSKIIISKICSQHNIKLAKS